MFHSESFACQQSFNLFVTWIETTLLHIGPTFFRRRCVPPNHKFKEMATMTTQDILSQKSKMLKAVGYQPVQQSDDQSEVSSLTDAFNSACFLYN